jgi:DNA-binding NarL/FixJ family response regulator
VVLTNDHPAARTGGGLLARGAQPGLEPPPSPRFDTSGPIRVVVADDSYLIRMGLREVVSSIAGVEVVAAVADGQSLLAAVRADPPDVVIADIRMPPSGEGEGLRIAEHLREAHPEVAVIVLSHHAHSASAVALLEDRAGGRGFLLKERLRDRAELQLAIETVAGGGIAIDPLLVRDILEADRRRRQSPLNDLTRRELEVLGEMAKGWSNAAIADTLVLSKRAVEKHVGSILQKLCDEDDAVISRRVSAVLLYLASGPGRRA